MILETIVEYVVSSLIDKHKGKLPDRMVNLMTVDDSLDALLKKKILPNSLNALKADYPELQQDEDLTEQVIAPAIAHMIYQTVFSGDLSDASEVQGDFEKLLVHDLPRDQQYRLRNLLDNYSEHFRRELAQHQDAGDALIIQALNRFRAEVLTQLGMLAETADTAPVNAPGHSKSRILISYSRANREFAEQLRTNLETIGFQVWRDVHDMQVGDDWWRQVTEAIDGTHTMVLCMSPEAIKSPVVAKEWQYARQVGTRVMPVFAADIDFKTVPRWMGRADWADFRPGAKEPEAVWGRFIDQLRRDYLPHKVAFMADDLPPYFVERPDEFEAMVNALVDQNGAVAITAAVSGAGGFGKTMLATALCHDTRVRGAFDDGILWVTLGEKPTEGDRMQKALDLVYLLTGTRPNVQEPEAVKTALREAIGDHYILLVLDDLWRRHDADLFMTDTPNSAVVITTRYDHTLPDVTRFRQNVDAMRLTQAVKLLAWNIEIDNHHIPVLEALAKRLGEWAVILRLANAQIRKQVTHGKSLDDALEWVDKALTRKGLKAFDPKDPDQRIDAVSSTIRASLELLDDETATQFARLAVFPEDAVVPFTTLECLWDLDDFDTEESASTIYEAGLLRDFDLEVRTIRLHDVIRRFLVDEHRDSLAIWHKEFVDNYDDLTNLPDSYAWNNIAYHLVHSGHMSMLRELMLNFRFLSTKLAATSPNALALDCKYFASESLLKIMHSFWEVSSRFSNQEEYFDQIHNQLIGRLGWHVDKYNEIKMLLYDTQSDAETSEKPQLILYRPSMAPAGTQLERILHGHTANISNVQKLSNSHILSWSNEDMTLRLWTKTGDLLVTFEGHSTKIENVIELASGYLLSWGTKQDIHKKNDNIMQIWSQTGETETLLEGHTKPILDVFEHPNGNILSLSEDTSIRIWDKNGMLLNVVNGYLTRKARTIMLSNGDLVSWLHSYSNKSDFELRLLDIEALRTIILKGHTSQINGVMEIDGNRILSWARDRTLRIWNMNGMLLNTLEGHTGSVSDALILSDGRILSWGEDCTLHIWSAEGNLQCTFKKHDSRIIGVLELKSGNLLSWEQNRIHLWQKDNGTFNHFCDQAFYINGVFELFDGRLLTWSKNSEISVWSSELDFLGSMDGHTNTVKKILPLEDGRILSLAQSSDMIIWNLSKFDLTTTQRKRMPPIQGILRLEDDRILSWTNDSQIHLWSKQMQHIRSFEPLKSTIKKIVEFSSNCILLYLDNGLSLWSIDEKNSFQLYHYNASNSALLRDGRIISWRLQQPYISSFSDENDPEDDYPYFVYEIWADDGSKQEGWTRYDSDIQHLIKKAGGELEPNIQTITNNTKRLKLIVQGKKVMVLDKDDNIVCQFLEDADLRDAIWLENGSVVVGGQSGVHHYLYPNAALQQILEDLSEH